MIDTIHEDLNWVKKKPYIEAKDSNGRDDKTVSDEHWDNFKQRNKSIIVDLFYGQFKSRLHCMKCDNISTTFDPFLSLSIPIPAYKQIKIKVTYYPWNMILERGLKNLEIVISAHANIKELKDAIKTYTKNDDELLIYESEKNKLTWKIKV